MELPCVNEHVPICTGDWAVCDNCGSSSGCSLPGVDNEGHRAAEIASKGSHVVRTMHPGSGSHVKIHTFYAVNEKKGVRYGYR